MYFCQKTTMKKIVIILMSIVSTLSCFAGVPEVIRAYKNRSNLNIQLTAYEINKNTGETNFDKKVEISFCPNAFDFDDNIKPEVYLSDGSESLEFSGYGLDCMVENRRNDIYTNEYYFGIYYPQNHQYAGKFIPQVLYDSSSPHSPKAAYVAIRKFGNNDIFRYFKVASLKVISGSGNILLDEMTMARWDEDNLRTFDELFRQLSTAIR